MKTILFQGDSITDSSRIYEEKVSGFKLFMGKIQKKTPLGTGYPALVAKELDGKGYKFINRGISGNRIADVYERMKRDILDIAPDYMSLLIGVNDVWHGFDEGTGTTKEKFEETYDLLLKELTEKLPKTKFIIMEPFVLEGTATGGKEGRYEKFRGGVEEMAEISKNMAEKYSVKFLCLQNVLDKAAENAPSSEILYDGVHPTEKGHKIIKNEWLKAFNEIK